MYLQRQTGSHKREGNLFPVGPSGTNHFSNNKHYGQRNQERQDKRPSLPITKRRHWSRRQGESRQQEDWWQSRGEMLNTCSWRLLSWVSHERSSRVIRLDLPIHSWNLPVKRIQQIEFEWHMHVMRQHVLQTQDVHGIEAPKEEKITDNRWWQNESVECIREAVSVYENESQEQRWWKLSRRESSNFDARAACRRVYIMCLWENSQQRRWTNQKPWRDIKKASSSKLILVSPRFVFFAHIFVIFVDVTTETSRSKNINRLFTHSYVDSFVRLRGLLASCCWSVSVWSEDSLTTEKRLLS